MKVIELNTKDKVSRILIGESIENLDKYVPKKTIIITDSNVARFYGKYFNKYKVIKIEPGEKSKRIQTIEEISRKLMKFRADRDSFILGIGGGVVTDITGFIASIFKRGLKFGFVSTTLLGQIDASIGGKNGIDFEEIKNVIGTFRHPEFVISDLTTLKTLPQQELINGMAELIKIALISDKEFFEDIEENFRTILDLDFNKLEYYVSHAAMLKAGIVRKDEKENGIRMILNFGHTFGHAVESVSGLSHGESVALGMLKAIEISVYNSGLNYDVYDRVKKLLLKVGLSVEYNYVKEGILNTMIFDKKKYGDKIKFVILNEIGKTEIVNLGFDELKRYL